MFLAPLASEAWKEKKGTSDRIQYVPNSITGIRVDLMLDHRRRQNQRKQCCQTGRMSRLISCIMASTVSLLLFLLTMLIVNVGSLTGSGNNEGSANGTKEKQWSNRDCFGPCRFTLVETSPYGLPATVSVRTTSESWLGLISSATQSIDIVSDTWDLSQESASTKQGADVVKQLNEASGTRGVKIRILFNAKDAQSSDIIQRTNGLRANVRSLDFNFLGSGLYPTNLLIIDGKTMYVGSAGFNRRSLSQVKEMGLEMQECSCLVQDISKQFEYYWHFSRKYSQKKKLQRTKYSNEYVIPVLAYLDAPAPFFCPVNTNASDYALLNKIVTSASRYVYVMMTDFSSAARFHSSRGLWDNVGHVLERVSSTKKLDVRVLYGWLNSTRDRMNGYLKPVQIQQKNSSIQTRLLLTPAERNVTSAQTNPSMYIVTDNMLYIAVSNWCHVNTKKFGGFSLVLDYRSTYQYPDKVLQKELRESFLRDWASMKYTKNVDHISPTYTIPAA
ncbi:5'-3' exonuclease PLD3-like isoform X2 [Tubulanus polymorphus]|uniref:5'-3' exonuclease PLD3-like isoform X2 n=1 Tax=Tubulanus polymorphus TaxID=672921 RepID=UPI003DA5F71E